MATKPDVQPKKRKKREKVKVAPAAPGHRGASPAARARRKGTVCERCNKHHVLANGKPACNGHKKRVRPYQPCPRPPINGAAVCLAHGGGSGIVRAKAEQRIAWSAVEGEVGLLLAEMDLPDQHPIDGLLEVVRHTGAMMRLLGSLVASLDLDPGEVKLAINEDDVTRYSDSDNGIFGYNHQGDQASHILVTMYGQWSERYARACKLALDANIDERLVRNAENTTNAVYVAIQRAFEEVKMPQDMVEAFGLALAKNLRKLAGPLDDLQRKAIGA